MSNGVVIEATLHSHTHTHTFQNLSFCGASLYDLPRVVQWQTRSSLTITEWFRWQISHLTAHLLYTLVVAHYWTHTSLPIADPKNNILNIGKQAISSFLGPSCYHDIPGTTNVCLTLAPSNTDQKTSANRRTRGNITAQKKKKLRPSH